MQRSAYVSSLVVEERRRRSGVGQALVHAARAAAAERWGAAWLYAHVAADNTASPNRSHHNLRTTSSCMGLPCSGEARRQASLQQRLKSAELQRSSPAVAAAGAADKCTPLPACAA